MSGRTDDNGELHAKAKERDAAAQLAVDTLEADQLVERQRARLLMWHARARFLGTVVFGAVALWRLNGASDLPERLTWIGVLVVVLGLASFDDIVKALGRGSRQ